MGAFTPSRKTPDWKMRKLCDLHLSSIEFDFMHVMFIADELVLEHYLGRTNSAQIIELLDPWRFTPSKPAAQRSYSSFN